MKKVLMAAVGVAALAAPAFADEGFYVKGGVGYGVSEDIGGTIAGQDADLEAEGDLRFNLGGGYAFQNGLRLEVEGADRYADTGAPGNNLGTSDIQNVAVMANALYDFDMGKLQPYVGAGLGWTEVLLKGAALVPGQTNPVGFADEEAGLGYQLLAGLGYELSDRLTADIGYRYFGAQTPKFDDLAVDVDFDDYNSHDLMVGLRYAFGAAPAPVAPPPATPAAAPVTCDNVGFTVYFDWDRSDLDAEDMDIIRAASDNAKKTGKCSVISVVVEGHTDTSGSKAYNLELSKRRALVVKEALIGQGIADSTISIAAKGEEDLAVATGDGVRNDTNRRTVATISVQ